MAGEVIASVLESIDSSCMKHSPARVTLPFAAAPTSSLLEKVYYPTVDMIVQKAKELLS
jgi:pyruvate dehydrogenase E1 component beta subunit